MVTKEAAPHRSDAPPECQPRRPRRDEAAALAPRHSDGRPEIDRRKALAAAACVLATPAYAETEIEAREIDKQMN